MSKKNIHVILYIFNFFLKILCAAVGIIFIFSCTSTKETKTDQRYIDQSFAVGKTANGMTYYIKANNKGKKQVIVSFIVNAGSILEEDNQRGLAHFVEHMGFNGSKKFPNNEIVSRLQKEGVRFGADLNAYTSFDKTVFKIVFPSEKMHLLDFAFDVVVQWAQHLSYDEKAIKAEKGVVGEEVRASLQPKAAAYKKMFQFMTENSKYALRNPGGSLDVIESAPREVIKSFYDKWYKPNLMAVAVVGDVDTEQVQQKIVEKFTFTDSYRERPTYSLPLENKDDLYVAYFNGGKNAQAVIQISFREPLLIPKTKKEFRLEMIQYISSRVISFRLADIKNESENFNYAVQDVSTLGSTNIQSVYIEPKEKKIKEAFEEVVTEIEKLRRYGIQKEEWEEWKKTMIDSFESDLFKYNNVMFTAAIVDNFINRSPLFEVKRLVEVLKTDAISLKEINTQLKSFAETSGIRIAFLSSDTDKVPEEQEVKDIYRGIKTAALTSPKKLDKSIENLIEKKNITGGSIVDEVYNEKNKSYTFTLSNGVKVIFRETEFDNVSMRAEAPNFLSADRKNKSDRYNVTFNSLAEVNSFLNFGDTSSVNMEKYFRRNRTNLWFYPSTSFFHIEGYVGSSDKLDSLFQSLYVYFTDIKFDNLRKAVFLSSLDSSIRSRLKNDYEVLSNRVTKNLYPLHDFYRSPSVDDVQKFDIKTVENILDDVTSDVSSYVFFFAGKVDINFFRSFIKNYIASIPVRKKAPTYKPYVLGINSKKSSQIRYKRGKGQEIVSLGWVNPLTAEQLTQEFVRDKNIREMLFTRIISSILSVVMTDEIREKNSDVYTIYPLLQIGILPQRYMEFRVLFQTEAKKTQGVIVAVKKIIDQLINKNLKKSVIERALAEVKSDIRIIKNENAKIISTMSNLYELGQDDKTILEAEQRLLELLDEITFVQVADYFADIFDGARYVEVIQEPEDD